MTDDITYIDGQAYYIVSRIPVSYPLPETGEQRKARGNGPAQIVAYTSCRIERADE